MGVKFLVGFMLLIFVSYNEVATQEPDPRLNDEAVEFVQKYIPGLASLNSTWFRILWSDNILAHRQQFPKYYEDVTQVNFTAPGTEENGNYDIPLTAFVPKGYQRSRKLFVFFHGAVWISGDMFAFVPVLTHLAGALKSIVVYIDFRRAPANGYPKGSNDCLVATRYIVENRNKLFKDLGCEKVGLISSSVGTNYALYVANELTKRDIAYHIAISPGHSFRPQDLVGGSAAEFNSSQYFIPIFLPIGLRVYAKPAVDTFGIELYNSKQFTPHLGFRRSTPTTLIISPALDPFLDQSRFLIRNRLSRKGVHAELNRIRGTIHGFHVFLGVFPKAFDEAFYLIKRFIARN